VGGANIGFGLASYLPYDLLYASDVDTDTELLSEIFSHINWEDRHDGGFDWQTTDFSETSGTISYEYPQNGYFSEDRLIRRGLSNNNEGQENSQNNQMPKNNQNIHNIRRTGSLRSENSPLPIS
jgi:hypothetical protein